MSLIIPPTRRHLYSPLRYPGGKASLYPIVEGIIRENRLANLTYVEPFAGGAGVALALLAEEKVDKVVINDFDPSIHLFWRAALEDTDRFVSKIRRTRVTVAQWRKQKSTYGESDGDSFSQGFATFFLNRTNRSGVLNGGPIGGLDQSGEWKIDARYNKVDLIARIRRLARLKDRIVLANEDGIELAKRYIGKDGVLIYLDPPYYVKGSFLYHNHYKDEDHKKLAKLLNANSSGRWLLSYDNVRQIRGLYPNRAKHSFFLNYHVRESRRGSEVLIMSDDLLLPAPVAAEH